MRFSEFTRKKFEVGDKETLTAILQVKELGFIPEQIWSPSPSVDHRTSPYRVPKKIMIGIRGSQETGAKFSPPPYAVIIMGGGRRLFVGIRAEAKWHLWNSAFFNATKKGIEVKIDLEGHSDPHEANKHIDLFVVRDSDDESDYSLLERGLNLCYPEGRIHPQEDIPSWWLMPVYCGYGDQVGISFECEGPDGPEARALAYCIQGLYERWIDILDQESLPFGTIIIDAGWSSGGVWQPNKIQWPDLRGFIDRQHSKGRKVLLWIATWYTEGLPDDWCIYCGSKKLVADPENPSYLSFIRNNIRKLLSDAKDCYNADGFKIDQLAYTPTERMPLGGEHFGRQIRVGKNHPFIKYDGKLWGCELLYKLQKEIYLAAKNTKKDCLITSSTVHPYFHDTFDMVRLHDAGVILPQTDVFEAMKARALLSKAALPSHPIDSDDWVHSYYDKWVDFTKRSWNIGVPCIFYAERFVVFRPEPKVLPVERTTLRAIAKAWKNYVKQI